MVRKVRIAQIANVVAALFRSLAAAADSKGVLRMFAMLVLYVLLPLEGGATPVRGPIPWDFIVCKFSDTGTPAYSMDYVREKVLGSITGSVPNPVTGSLADWVEKTSYGAANLSDVTIHGYYTIPETYAKAKSIEGVNIGGGQTGSVYSACQSAASAGKGEAAFTSQGGRGLSVLTWPDVNTYGGLGFSLDGVEQQVGELAHEFGHGIGLNHSWSTDYNFNSPPGAGGDYGNQWDQMSYANVYSASTAPYDVYGAGPGLDGYHLDALGWIPLPRVISFKADGIRSRTVTLAPLNHPEVAGNLLVRIPMDKTNPLHYFTVEFVTLDGYYSGIPGGQIFINEVSEARLRRTSILSELHEGLYYVLHDVSSTLHEGFIFGVRRGTPVPTVFRVSIFPLSCRASRAIKQRSSSPTMR